MALISTLRAIKFRTMYATPIAHMAMRSSLWLLKGCPVFINLVEKSETNTHVNMMPTAIRLICSASVIAVVGGNWLYMLMALADAANIAPSPIPKRADDSVALNIRDMMARMTARPEIH
jgi:hypothetical protein